VINAVLALRRDARESFDLADSAKEAMMARFTGGKEPAEKRDELTQPDRTQERDELTRPDPG
jgi:hypothetical protein